MEIYLDIETVPTDRDDIRLAIDARFPLLVDPEPVTPEWRLTDNARVAADIEAREARAWADLHAKKKMATQRRIDAFRDTALDGGVGRIVSIAVTIDDGEVFVSALNPNNGGEVKLLDKLNGTLAAYPTLKDATLVAHYAEFDVRFIYQRAAVLGMLDCLPSWWPTLHSSRASDRVYDTMTLWAGYGNRISLDRLCVNLGLPGKSDVTGADVYTLWQAHKCGEIARYNAGDVHRLRSVHRRMNGRPTLQIDIDALSAGAAVAKSEAA